LPATGAGNGRRVEEFVELVGLEDGTNGEGEGAEGGKSEKKVDEELRVVSACENSGERMRGGSGGKEETNRQTSTLAVLTACATPSPSSLSFRLAFSAAPSLVMWR
jgi:hypothetical protein